MASPSSFTQLNATALLLVGILSCSYGRDHNVVTGWITPDYFNFQELVALKPGDDEGGWRAACVRATMRDGNSGSKVVCQIEVGIPIKTRKEGWISVTYAREVAAITANDVAYVVLSELGAGSMLGLACQQFKSGFERLFTFRFPGSRVRQACDARLAGR